MGQEEKAPERGRRDWIIILIILLFGFLCVILAGQWAIRFSPTWRLNTDMGSNIDPNSDFLTNRSNELLEPLDPAILTQPVWFNVFLTPGASFETRTSVPTTAATSTQLATGTTLPTFTSTLPPTATNTLIYLPPPPPTSTPRPPSPPSPTPVIPTNTPATASADLQITKNDGIVVYEGSTIAPPNTQTVVYNVTVSNNGPANVTGAIVSDSIPAQVTNWDWTCTTVTNASDCNGVIGSPLDFTDTVNIQNGGSIVYTVTAYISTNPSGSLTNTAAVDFGINDPVPGNNSSTDTDELAESLPYGDLDLGLPPDGNDEGLSDGESLVIELPSPGLVVNGDPGWDLIYFEESNAPGIAMDWIILQIGDGTNWYTILNWGNGVSDGNTNIAIPLVGNSGGDCSGEPDNCDIDGSLLAVESGYNTGVTINVDGLGIPLGTYSYLRISVPVGGDNDGVAIDGIYIYP